jgi:hypothetical protein
MACSGRLSATSIEDLHGGQPRLTVAINITVIRIRRADLAGAEQPALAAGIAATGAGERQNA